MIELRYMIEHQCFITCPLLNTSDFIKFCKGRDIDTTEDQLEHYEKLKIFYPLLRVKYPKVRYKIKYSDNGLQYTDLGRLVDDEDWAGDIKEEYAQLYFERNLLMNWYENGLVWDPSKKTFQEWQEYKDENNRNKVDSFYSIYQAYELDLILSLTTLKINLGFYINNEQNYLNNIDKNLSMRKDIVNTLINGNKRKFISYLCQIISNRYFPHTQTDKRRINLRYNSLTHNDWDWIEYIKKWDANNIFLHMGLNIKYIKNMQNIISVDLQFIDPLFDWYELVQFISVDQKKKLSGKALFAQTLYSMEYMIRLFVKDLTDEKVRPPNEKGGRPDWKNKLYGEDITNNQLKYLQYITNQFHLNPKPNLVLVLEGKGEEEIMPELILNITGYDIATLGIEIRNLTGISNFTGQKKYEKLGALEKFIDDHHTRQTFVYIILDNEGRAMKIRDKLINAESKFSNNRKVTLEDYIHIWNKNIEFDNFTNHEIASALTDICNNEFEFIEQKIAQCRDAFKTAKESNLISNLYEDKTGKGLPKTKLLIKLFDTLINNLQIKTDKNTDTLPPIIAVVNKIVDLAMHNYQPISNDTWKSNQESGYFG